MNTRDTQKDTLASNPSATERDRTRDTPGTDMQAEDTGTAASGTQARAGRAMKQFSKTDAERGEPEGRGERGTR